MNRRRVEPEPITQVRVYEKGIPEHGEAMEHVARAFGFQSANHMRDVCADAEKRRKADHAWRAAKAKMRAADRRVTQRAVEHRTAS